MSISARVLSLDWGSIDEQVDTDGYALIDAFLSPSECESLARLYDSSPDLFRSTINMVRHNFGSGQYRYFSYPLPDIVQDMRESLYPRLATLANQWASHLGYDVRWPDAHHEFIDRCHESEQRRPTPLLLNYVAGDYNCLHQDLYGDIYFPLQVVIMLSNPLSDFDGGELVLVENRPRMQSRVSVIGLSQGCAAVIPVRERLKKGARGYYRAQVRHGVSDVRSGRRQTIGIIFHDAS